MAMAADSTRPVTPAIAGNDEEKEVVKFADLIYSSEDRTVTPPYGVSVADLCGMNQIGAEDENMAKLRELGNHDGLLSRLVTNRDNGVAANSLEQRRQL
jgi:hypothetical protein